MGRCNKVAAHGVYVTDREAHGRYWYPDCSPVCCFCQSRLRIQDGGFRIIGTIINESQKRSLGLEECVPKLCLEMITGGLTRGMSAQLDNQNMLSSRSIPTRTHTPCYSRKVTDSINEALATWIYLACTQSKGAFLGHKHNSNIKSRSLNEWKTVVRIYPKN